MAWQGETKGNIFNLFFMLEIIFHHSFLLWEVQQNLLLLDRSDPTVNLETDLKDRWKQDLCV
jgi:hypothetical protein